MEFPEIRKNQEVLFEVSIYLGYIFLLFIAQLGNSDRIENDRIFFPAPR